MSCVKVTNLTNDYNLTLVLHIIVHSANLLKVAFIGYLVELFILILRFYLLVIKCKCLFWKQNLGKIRPNNLVFVRNGDFFRFAQIFIANFCASIAHEAKKHIPNIPHFFASYATSFGPKLLCFMSFKPSSKILVPKPVLP